MPKVGSVLIGVRGHDMATQAGIRDKSALQNGTFTALNARLLNLVPAFHDFGPVIQRIRLPLAAAKLPTYQLEAELKRLGVTAEVHLSFDGGKMDGTIPIPQNLGQLMAFLGRLSPGRSHVSAWLDMPQKAQSPVIVFMVANPIISADGDTLFTLTLSGLTIIDRKEL